MESIEHDREVSISDEEVNRRREEPADSGLDGRQHKCHTAQPQHQSGEYHTEKKSKNDKIKKSNKNLTIYRTGYHLQKHSLIKIKTQMDWIFLYIFCESVTAARVLLEARGNDRNDLVRRAFELWFRELEARYSAEVDVRGKVWIEELGSIQNCEENNRAKARLTDLTVVEIRVSELNRGREECR